jgi:hypothetical protein
MLPHASVWDSILSKVILNYQPMIPTVVSFAGFANRCKFAHCKCSNLCHVPHQKHPSGWNVGNPPKSQWTHECAESLGGWSWTPAVHAHKIFKASICGGSSRVPTRSVKSLIENSAALNLCFSLGRNATRLHQEHIWTLMSGNYCRKEWGPVAKCLVEASGEWFASKTVCIWQCLIRSPLGSRFLSRRVDKSKFGDQILTEIWAQAEVRWSIWRYRWYEDIASEANMA